MSNNQQLQEQQLKEGISILYDMELNNYLMARGIEQLNRNISNLGVPKRFYEPKLAENHEGIWDYTEVVPPISAFLGAIIGAIVGIFTEGGSGFGGFFNGLLGAFVYGLIGVVIGAVAGFVIGLIWGIISHSKENTRLQQIYELETASYHRAIEDDKLRVKREQLQKTELIKQREALTHKLNESQQLLDLFYSIVEIDETYRNIVPIGYMNEFIRIGISRKLEGADGLYYLIRRELQLQDMTRTLTEIRDKLDEIIDNQKALYSELCDINRKCDHMIDLTLQTVKNSENALKKANTTAINTEIIAYNTERTQRELEFQNFMLLY